MVTIRLRVVTIGLRVMGVHRGWVVVGLRVMIRLGMMGHRSRMVIGLGGMVIWLLKVKAPILHMQGLKSLCN